MSDRSPSDESPSDESPTEETPTDAAMAEAAISEEAPALPGRLLAALRNAIDLARLGRLEQTAHAPYEVAIRHPNFRLRHYGSARPGDFPPLLMIPPLMLTADVYDVAPQASAVTKLSAFGVDPWVVDFGAPERQEGGLKRTLTDHILAIDAAVEHVRRATGRDVHLAGYSQGGIFAYLAAAYRRSEGLASVVTFGTPVNVHERLLPGVPDEVALPAVEFLGRVLSSGFSGSAVPAWLTRTTFKMLSPTKELSNQLDFLRSLHDREALLKREGQRRFMAEEGWVAWPGPAFAEFIDQMIQGNRLFAGGFVVEGSTVTLADITCPVLAFVGLRDEIARKHAVRSVAKAAPRAELFEAAVPAGHMGLVVGSFAMRETWPSVAAWIDWREGEGELPEIVVPMGTERPRPAVDPSDDEEVEGGGLVDLAGSLGREAVRSVVGLLGDGADTLLALSANVTSQLPRLARLEALRRSTRVGLAMTLDEQATDNPEATFFLYEGRAHSYAAANRRVDAIVRGLLSIGVRPGDHVGLLMGTRPSALAVATAINRLGAVTVFLRDEGEIAAEIDAARVDHLISDPEHAAMGKAAFDGVVYVLGGVGAAARGLPDGVRDMEAIDPDSVAVPEWYAPSPGRAEDVAFVFFAGRGSALRANRVTNRRWAQSALGAASGTAMSASDTVYSWTPVQHPTGLLVSVSGALAAGARLAVAQGFTPETFWEEVRRYGASVVFYTGTMLREMLDAPKSDAERNHPVRMFAGSGMPRVLWRRAIERWGPVAVLEFYASTEGSAIFANVSGRKIGSVGRPIPGSAEVALAAWDVDADRPLFDASGYVLASELGEPGMLLAKVERERGSVESKPLRNVFERGDAWHVTGSLFRVDADGDYWLVDHTADMIRTAEGPLSSIAIEDSLWELDAVSAAAAYGSTETGGDDEVPNVALVLRKGRTLETEELSRVVTEALDEPSRPRRVHVVDRLPMTAGYRILKGPLRARKTEPDRQTFVYDSGLGEYVEVEE